METSVNQDNLGAVLLAQKQRKDVLLSAASHVSAPSFKEVAKISSPIKVTCVRTTKNSDIPPSPFESRAQNNKMPELLDKLKELEQQISILEASKTLQSDTVTAKNEELECLESRCSSLSDQLSSLKRQLEDKQVELQNEKDTCLAQIQKEKEDNSSDLRKSQQDFLKELDKLYAQDAYTGDIKKLEAFIAGVEQKLKIKCIEIDELKEKYNLQSTSVNASASDSHSSREKSLQGSSLRYQQPTLSKSFKKKNLFPQKSNNAGTVKIAEEQLAALAKAYIPRNLFKEWNNKDYDDEESNADDDDDAEPDLEEMKKLLKCRVCDSQFKFKFNLRSHIKKYHVNVK